MKRIVLFLLPLILLLALLAPPVRAAEVPHNDRYGYGTLTTDPQRTAYRLLEEGIARVDDCILLPGTYHLAEADVTAAADALTKDRHDFFYYRSAGYVMHIYNDDSIAFCPRYVLGKTITTDLSRSEIHTRAGKTERELTALYNRGVGISTEGSITISEIRTAKNTYEAKISAILQGLPTGSDTDKTRYLHDYLADNVVYARSDNDQNAYSAIVEGTTVCAGYGKAYQDLLSRIGIRCWFITGTAINSAGVTEAHGWNVLWLDGKCVYTDVTWADQKTYIRYRYFQISREQMEQNHQMNPEYAAVLPACGHESYHLELTPDNLGGALQATYEYTFSRVGSSIHIRYENVSETLRYYTSNSTVATVTQDGKVTAVGEGTCRITIIFPESGYAQQYRITVGNSHNHQLSWVAEVAATCSKTGTASHYICTGCEKLYADDGNFTEITDPSVLILPKNNIHTNLKQEKGYAPTCTQAGRQNAYRCADCGGLFSDAKGQNAVKNEDSLAIAPKGHTQSPWQSDDAGHWKTCTVCSAVTTGKTGHADENGDRKCDTCGYAVAQPTEPSTEATEPPTEPSVAPPITEPPVTEPKPTQPAPTEPVPTEPTVSEATKPETPTAAPTQPASPPETSQTQTPTEATEKPITPEAPIPDDGPQIIVLLIGGAVCAALLALILSLVVKKKH